MMARSVRILVLAVVLAIPVSAPVSVAAEGSVAAVPSAGPDPRTYRPPVVAPVTDPFRPPDQPWLSGNRGLEYATTPGATVGAIGPGVVVFAGPVAGSLYVTVQHPDGLRSSYSYLAAIRVALGDRVATGQRVGVAAERLHLGVRRGEQYLDPAELWGRRVRGGRALLVPLEDHDRSTPHPRLQPPRRPMPLGPAPPGRSDGPSSPGRSMSDLGATLADAVTRISLAAR